MKVLLLAGGSSSEREVSFDSGRAIYEVLHRLGHEVTALDPAFGVGLLNEDQRYVIPESIEGETLPNTIDERAVVTSLTPDALEDVDVVFIGLHGGTGENGTIQCLLDLAGKKYTGSGMTASTVAMDKNMTKRLARSADVRTPTWALCSIEDGIEETEILEQIRSNFSLPLIVKPNQGGSTVGLTKVETLRQLYPALVKASAECPQVLVEQYIKGRELTAAVLDGEALPVVEIVPEGGLYDYEAKYTEGKSNYIVPAEISREIKEGLQEDATILYDMVGASGLARVDFKLDENEKHFFLEINTLPGMTALSLAPMAAKAGGITFDDLIIRLLDSALKR
ncbi:MAG: D-alanine--D-alanine ligase [candidate division Zixibacteria bacterium]|nr:D-alanine--D-alanine ligase [candidate division Zixibacteria bacterium]